MTGKKQIACFFNTDKLGGAERSFVLQLIQMQDDANIHCFIPLLEPKSEDLIEFIKLNNIKNVSFFPISNSFYKISRTNIKFLFKIPTMLFEFLSKLHWFARMRKFDMVYLNGNKCGVYLYACLKLLRVKVKTYWHLRDYPYDHGAFKLFWKNLKNSKSPEIQFIANSYSVKKHIDSISSKNPKKSLVIYNQSGLRTNDDFKKNKNISKIGIVSMFSYWKGIHQGIFFAGMFEKELRKLGITEFSIYGDNIYKTNGNQGTMSDEFKKMAKRFSKTSFIKFYGLEKPEKIFKEIDILLHLSISPEPFGRVIAEAFSYKVPVISTALGGAAELVKNNVTGLVVAPHDYDGLYESIRLISEGNTFAQELISNAYAFSIDLQLKINEQTSKLFY